MADNTKNQQNKASKPAFTKEKGRGTVKAVTSGDTIVVLQVDKTQQGLPVERTITLSNIQAPLLARKRPEKKTDKLEDEDYAWASREYLRKKAIGKNVSYTIEYKNPNTNKEFGVVHLVTANGEENLATSVVAQGWAKVKKPNNPPKEGGYRPELQELITLEEDAQKADKGIWNKDPVDLETAKRPNLDTSSAAVFEQFKGKSLTGVVEQVRTGSSLRVMLVPSFYEINLFLSGASAPEQDQNGQFQPFGREAKFFTEHHVLNRDANIVLEGIDRYNFYGTVSLGTRNLAEELLKAGLAKYVDWSGSKSAFAEKLKAAEKVAKDARQRVWSVPSSAAPEPKAVAAVTTAATSAPKNDKASTGSFKPGKEIAGKVVEVVNGGTVVVLDQGGNEHKINLSSIKVSKLVNPLIKGESKPEAGKKPDEKKSRDAVERAYAIEAKEYLRRRLVGHRVKCVYDYTRPPPPATANAPQRTLTEAERSYYSVYLDNKNNVSVELVEQGLAQAAEHRGGESRSKDYELILMAEDRSKKSHKGIWAPDDKAPVFYVTDVTKLDANKARQYLPYLKRNGRQRAVIDYEFSGSRFKVYVPKESAYVMFTVAAIRTPFRNEEFFRESVQFAREHLHQRDVEIEVLAQDKGGSFLGNLWVNKKNYATLALGEGLAETMGSVKESEHSTEFIIAEESAKRSKKNLWKNYDEAAEKEKAKQEKEKYEESKKPKQNACDVNVTEIVDGSNFYVQIVRSDELKSLGADAEALAELMKKLAAETSDQAYKPVIGELVKAQFTADDAWYRAKVTDITPQGEYDVLYIDYGNTETVPAARLRVLNAEYKDLPAQAFEAQLAFVRTPGLDEDYGQDAAMLLRDLVLGKTLLANVEYKDGNKLFLSLLDNETHEFVNGAVVRAGLARVENVRSRHVNPMVERLRDEEDKARSAHSFIWEYGDPGFDDVDEDAKASSKKPAPKPVKKQ